MSNDNNFPGDRAEASPESAKIRQDMEQYHAEALKRLRAIGNGSWLLVIQDETGGQMIMGAGEAAPEYRDWFLRAAAAAMVESADKMRSA